MEQELAPLIVLKELAGNPRPELNAIQQLLAPHTEFLVTLWISVWVMTAIILVALFVREYMEHRKELVEKARG